MSNSRSVLLVEDNVLLAQLLRSTLEELGCRVTHTVKARDAMLWLSANEPALVVLDDELPDGWGADIARAIRMQDERNADEQEGAKPLPIIAMRTEPDVLQSEPWVPDRQTVIIDKPIQLHAFSALVLQYLDTASLPDAVDVDLEELEDTDPLSAYAGGDDDDSPAP